jgi:hypothetical protein
MTEDRWQKSTHVDAMIDQCRRFPAPRALNSRKSRLFACGCFRILWPSIQCRQVRRSVEVAEARADRLATDQQMEEHRYPYGGEIDSLDHGLQLAVQSLMIPNLNPAYVAWGVRASIDPFRYGPNQYSEGCPEQADLLRDVVGNPFRAVAFEAGWRTSTAVALAQQMYDSRDFGIMPILGDALQDAGCESADVLDHCRRAGPHVRGCWVVDAILRKK